MSNSKGEAIMSEARAECAVYRGLVWVVAIIVLTLFASRPSSAQQTTGIILGTVTDQSGALVPGAKVTVVNTDTSDTRTAPTGGDGSFRFPALVAGHYSVTVEASGFKSETQKGLTLAVALEMVINSKLEVGNSTQQVTVTGQPPLIDTSTTSLGNLVNESRVANLPLNGRNYADLTYMQPGINTDPNISSSSSQGGLHGTFFSADGAGIRQNLYLLDGATQINSRGGAAASESGTTLGIAGIKEFQVVTGVFDASYGLAPGAQILMVSKGGTNQFHGGVFEYLRNNVMDAANYFDKPTQANNYARIPGFKRNNFGGSGGGPIKKDRTFFFGAYEGIQQAQGETINDTVPGAGCHGPTGNNTGVVTSTACPQLGAGAPSVTIAPVMQQILSLYPVPNLPNNQFTYPYTSPLQENWGQVRVDENLSASDTMFGRYTMDRAYSVEGTLGLTAAAGVAFPQFAGSYFSFNQSATIAENHVFSSSLLNQARLSYTRINALENNVYPVNSYSPNGKAGLTGPGYSFVQGLPVGNISLSGYSTLGVISNDPQAERENTYSLADDLYYTKGKHALRFGMELNKYNYGYNIFSSGQGTVTFSSLSGILTGVAASYSALQLGTSAITTRNWMFWVPGFYAQDDWRATHNLTLNLGLRYEFFSVPSATDGRNYRIVNRLSDALFTQGPIFAGLGKLHFQPRVGFDWDVLGKGKTSVRGGFGEYYDMNWAYESLNDQGQPPLSAKITHTGGTTPITLPFTFLPTDPLAAGTIDYYSKNPYVLKWNLAIEQQLPGNMLLLAAYVGTHGIHLYQSIEGNLVEPAGVVGGFPYWAGGQARVNPNWGSIGLTTNTGSSNYNGLNVSFNKPLSHGLEFQTSYDYSKLLGNANSGVGASDCSGATGENVDDYYGPGPEAMAPGSGYYKFNKGPECTDVTNNLRFNLIYHIPNINSNNIAARVARGWMVAGIWSTQGGYPFTPVLGTNRSQSQIMSTQVDRANVATSADVANCTANPSSCKYTPVPFNKNTVIQHKPTQWFNPNMFAMQPMVNAPGGAVCTSSTCTATTTYGTIGDASRGLLRGPKEDNVDFTINKDTHLAFLGEGGNLEFGAQIFNLLNHPYFNMPNGTVFTGKTTDYGSYSEAPSSSAGAITSTAGASREVQLMLKVDF
jgi:hypothetical protein